MLIFLLQAPAPATGASALLQQGLLNLKEGQFAAARESLLAATRADPANAYAWVSLAEAELRLQHKQPALAAAKKAEQAGSADPVAAHALAMFYSSAGDWAKAAALEQRFAESPRADAGAAERTAGMYLNAGDVAHAAAAARNALDTHPTPQAEDILGRALLAAGKNDEGVRHLSHACDTAQGNGSICFDYAQALLQAQDFSAAAAVLSDAAKASPNDPQLNLALGVARYGQRRFADAIAAFLATIRLDARIPQPYLFLGRMLDQAGDQLSQITAAFRQWMQLEPRRPEPPLLLAKALAAANAPPDEAELLLRKSLALNAKSWETHYELGLLLAKKHDYKSAASQFEQSIAIDPKQPMPHYHLARAYDRLGESDRAASERAKHQRLTAANPGGVVPP